MSYHHLTTNDRISVERFYQLGLNVTQIAERIGVHKSTISRDHGYTADGAQKKTEKRRKNSSNKPILSQNQEALDFVLAGLEKRWSPEQISHVMPEDIRVSTATIYRAIEKKS